MTISLGRRRLILSLAVQSSQPTASDVPSALGATDAELAHINADRLYAGDRPRWDAMALMYGGQRLDS